MQIVKSNDGDVLSEVQIQRVPIGEKGYGSR